jgi:hypothetical protein
MGNVILAAFRVFFPSFEDRSAPDYPTLRERNVWILAVAQILFVAGFGLALLWLPEEGTGRRWLSIGLACGMAVAVPFAWVCLATLPFGLDRYREFWRFHQLHYELDTKGAVALAAPFAVLGVICGLVLLLVR